MVFGWFCGGCYVAMVCVIENHDGPGHAVSPIIFYPLTALYFFGFMPSPIWFVILCWKNLDVNILRLLWTQMQFRFIVMLTVWVAVVYTGHDISLRQLKNDDQVENYFRSVCLSAVTVSPLAMILFVDAMKQQSKLFRIALPAAYLFFVCNVYVLFAFFKTEGHPMFNASNSTPSALRYAAATTFEGQLSSSIFSILVLMVGFLDSTRRDTEGDAIHFPVRIAQVRMLHCMCFCHAFLLVSHVTVPFALA